jgi:hypothetical protein
MEQYEQKCNGKDKKEKGNLLNKIFTSTPNNIKVRQCYENSLEYFSTVIYLLLSFISNSIDNR